MDGGISGDRYVSPLGKQNTVGSYRKASKRNGVGNEHRASSTEREIDAGERKRRGRSTCPAIINDERIGALYPFVRGKINGPRSAGIRARPPASKQAAAKLIRIVKNRDPSTTTASSERQIARAAIGRDDSRATQFAKRQPNAPAGAATASGTSARGPVRTYCAIQCQCAIDGKMKGAAADTRRGRAKQNRAAAAAAYDSWAGNYVINYSAQCIACAVSSRPAMSSATAGKIQSLPWCCPRSAGGAHAVHDESSPGLNRCVAGDGGSARPKKIAVNQKAVGADQEIAD